jgi:hypothetical protein
MTQNNGIIECRFASGHPYNKISQDCPEIEAFIAKGLDAKWIKPGDLVGFNLIPGNSATITFVKIEEEPVVEGVHRAKIYHFREVGSTTTLQIGVWIPGEGRNSLRAAAMQAIALCIDPRDLGKEKKIWTKCPNPGHGLYEDRILREQVSPSTDYKTVCLINMVLEKMCTACLVEVSPSVNDSFGLPKEAENWYNA